MKYNWITLLFFAIGISSSAQVKYEKEFRIEKSQFPEISISTVAPYIKDVKRLRFYKEIDSSLQTYEIKFRKDRLHYSIEFSDEGELQDIKITIKPVDIPDQSWITITENLNENFEKFKVRKIQQQYPRAAFASDAITFRNTFQNLLLPEIRYEIEVHDRTARGNVDYQFLYNAEGGFIRMRKSLPPNYDHVLY